MATLQPVQVQYCALCGLPEEFCEYNTEVPHPAAGGGAGGAQAAPAAGADGAGKAAQALAGLSVAEGGGEAGAAGAQPAAPAAGGEGGDAEAAAKKSSKKKAKTKQVVIERATRNKRKCVTTVIGLDLFGVKLADASKKFGKKFACGASVVKDASQKEQIDVQGDFMDEIAEFICKEWSEVTMDDIKLVDKEKK